MGNNAKSVLKIAKSRIGWGNKWINKYYGNPIGTAWCGAFVFYCFKKAGAGKAFCSRSSNPAYVPNIDNWGSKRKVNRYNGKPGDIVIFDWGGDGTRDHVGFIYKNHGGGVYTTIEGNTGGGLGTVMFRRRYRSDIYSIIRPKYDKKKPSKKTGLKSNTTIAKEVIRGKWGNGKTRIKKLKTAGYDPAAIQKEVNRLLK